MRGIGVTIDRIPVNDPSGFAPDLYDVEWGIVKKIEVMRLPVLKWIRGMISSVFSNQAEETRKCSTEMPVTAADSELKPIYPWK